jgi:hypothetical protein
MTGIVGSDGQELGSVLCPKCGAPPKDHETVTGFGGHWRKVCQKCGQELGSSQEGTR